MDACMSYGRRKDKSRIIGSDIFKASEDIQRPVDKIGVYASSDGRLSGTSGSYATVLNEPEKTSVKNKEDVDFNKKKEEATKLVLSIQSKFEEIQDIIEEQTVGFFIRFDSSLYPDVSNAVRFYSDRQYDNYIDQSSYDRALADRKKITQQQYDLINQSISNTDIENGEPTLSNYGSSGVVRQIDKQKKINVIILAFKQLLALILDWFYSTPVVGAALGFFFKSREHANTVLNRMGITGNLELIDGQWQDVTSRTEISDDEVTSDDRVASNADILLKYVMDVVLENESYIEANIPNPNAYIILDLMSSLQTQFVDAVELTTGFLDDEGVRAIGRTSMLHVPLSPINTPSSRYLSTHLEPIFQEEFLRSLDSSLERILRVLQGWYLDPRTYCCLINALGGISSLVPKWLYTLRFGIQIAKSGIALDIQDLLDRSTNLLNLIVQGIIGAIVSQLYYVLNGFASAKEHELMMSILDQESELVKCLPFDVLVSEFRIAFQDMLSKLRSKVGELSGRLMISAQYSDQVITLLERKMRLDRLLQLMDAFIATWEFGYICSDNERVVDFQDPLFNTKDLPDGLALDLRTRAAILGSLNQLPSEDKKRLGIESIPIGSRMVPPVSVDEITNFLTNRLKLDDDTVQAVKNIYSDDTMLQECLNGLSNGTLQSYKSQIDKILSS